MSQKTASRRGTGGGTGAGTVRTFRSWTRQPVSRVPSACASSQYSVVTAIAPTITADLTLALPCLVRRVTPAATSPLPL